MFFEEERMTDMAQRFAFPPKVPIMIAGRIKKSVSEKNYVGAYWVERDVERYYVAGIPAKTLKEKGFKRTDDLFVLQSKNQNGSLDVVTFHSQERFVGLGFLITDELEQTFRRAGQLHKLIAPPPKFQKEIPFWAVFEIESPHSHSPYQCQLIPTPLVAPFDYMKPALEKISTVGFDVTLDLYKNGQLKKNQN